MGRRKKTTEEFIVDARAVHGDRYSYDSVDYIGSADKVIITCLEHGKFHQRPDSHLSGQGCPECADVVTKTRRGPRRRYNSAQEFIEDAKIVHGCRYDYSQVVYSKTTTKIQIICLVHGKFPQTPANHLAGKGCPYCAGRGRTSEDFIELAKLAHGDRYDYTEVEFTYWDHKVNIICSDHGKFPQIARLHIDGSGCPKCIGRNKTTEEFVLEAKQIHGDTYDYSLTTYVKHNASVSIICKEHGEFPQTPNIHLNGSGCPTCAKSGFDPSKESTFYIYTFEDYAGFGITNDFKTRSSTHSRTFKKKGIDANLVATYNMTGILAQSLEKYLKQTLPIINTGIDGFKTEAVHINDLPILLDTIKQYESI